MNKIIHSLGSIINSIKPLIIVILTCCNLVNAQNYKPLLDDTNEWNFTNCYFGCLTDIYYTDGDTLVAGNNFKILDGYHYISRDFLIREELSNQRAYLRKLNNNTIGED